MVVGELSQAGFDKEGIAAVSVIKYPATLILSEAVNVIGTVKLLKASGITNSVTIGAVVSTVIDEDA